MHGSWNQNRENAFDKHQTKDKCEKIHIRIVFGNNRFFPYDSLSATLFTLYLAGALHHLRAETKIPNPPICCNLMPSDSQYVNDIYFYNESESYLKEEKSEKKSLNGNWKLMQRKQCILTSKYQQILRQKSQKIRETLKYLVTNSDQTKTFLIR